MITAIYGCWKGHSSKRKAENRDLVAGSIVCGKCNEEAILYDVISKQENKLGLRVVKGGKSD